MSARPGPPAVRAGDGGFPDEIVDDVFEDVARVVDGVAEDCPVSDEFLFLFFEFLFQVREKTYRVLDEWPVLPHPTEPGAFASRPLHPAIELFLIRIGRREGTQA